MPARLGFNGRVGGGRNRSAKDTERHEEKENADKEEEEKKQKEEEKKNEEEEEKDKKNEDEEKKNSHHFDSIKNSIANSDAPNAFDSCKMIDDKLALGKEKY